MTQQDEGLGIAEVLVSMLMLVVITLAFLPVLTGTLQLSADSSRLTTASGLADARVSDIRARTAECGAFNGTTTTTGYAGNGAALRVRTTVTCPSTLPALAPVLVTVDDEASGENLVTVRDSVWMKG